MVGEDVFYLFVFHKYFVTLSTADYYWGWMLIFHVYSVFVVCDICGRFISPEYTEGEGKGFVSTNGVLFQKSCVEKGNFIISLIIIKHRPIRLI